MCFVAGDLSTESEGLGRSADDQNIGFDLVKPQRLTDRRELISYLVCQPCSDGFGHCFGVSPRGFVDNQCFHWDRAGSSGRGWAGGSGGPWWSRRCEDASRGCDAETACR